MVLANEAKDAVAGTVARMEVTWRKETKWKRNVNCVLFRDREREREKINKMQQSDVYYQHCLNMFRASLGPSSG